MLRVSWLAHIIEIRIYYETVIVARDRPLFIKASLMLGLRWFFLPEFANVKLFKVVEKKKSKWIWKICNICLRKLYFVMKSALNLSEWMNTFPPISTLACPTLVWKHFLWHCFISAYVVEKRKHSVMGGPS